MTEKEKIEKLEKENKELKEKLTEKDYKEIILFLLDELEWHHSGIKDFYLRSIENKYNIDF